MTQPFPWSAQARLTRPRWLVKAPFAESGSGFVSLRAIPIDLFATPITLVAIVLGAIGGVLVGAGLAALVRARPLRFALRTLAGLLLLACGALLGTIAIGTQGYRALTREDLAARLIVRPTGPQRFSATVRFPEGSEKAFDIAGDEIYVDARILKWKPVANFLGLHTAYELDRIAGRYRSIDQERTAPRTIYSLAEDKSIDLFTLRQRHAFLAAFFDADYGSGTFTRVTGPAELEVRVSTTGLLIREVLKPGG